MNDNILDKISSNIDKIVKVMVFFSIVGMILVISLQIISRVLFSALTWSEELSRYLLVWSTFLGATLAYKRGMHISVTFVVEAFPPKMNKLIKVLSILLSMVFFAVAIKFGIQYILMQKIQVSAALRIPMKYIYTVIPLSFSIMIVHGICGLKNVIIGNEGGRY